MGEARKTSTFHKLLCVLFGHYTVDEYPLSERTMLKRCKDCEELFAFNVTTGITLPYGDALENLYSERFQAEVSNDE